MTFDEFFKKKRVDLIALEKAEPALFSEFKTHYNQMGEKSFDHTKKYWFNKTRRQFPLAPEVKTEKVHIANPIAEQTITESLTEHTPPVTSAPKVGFTPKFRAANTPKPIVEDKKEELSAVVDKPAEPVENTPVKPAGFVPRFKMKPKAETEESAPVATETPQTVETTGAKPAYVPKFKMKPKAETEESISASVEPSITEPIVAKPTGFVPRFKMKPKAETEESVPPVADEAAPPPEPAEKKPAYKPRFVPPKPKE